MKCTNCPHNCEILGENHGICHTRLANIKTASSLCHVELTTLVVPQFNDSVSEMETEAELIAQIDESIPLHILRFFPNKTTRNLAPTPVETIYELVKTASAKLKYVYPGNC